MTYNECKTCKAKDGRAGNLINGDCLNCYHTRTSGNAVLYAGLRRTDDEIKRTFAIIPDGLTQWPLSGNRRVGA